MSDLITMMAAVAGQQGEEEADPNFNQTVLLLHGDGSDGAQNNTFLDSSDSPKTITRNPTSGPNAPTQGAFSPFSAPDGRWSNYFDGDDHLLLSANADFGLSTGSFTFEAWIYTADTSFMIMCGGNLGSAGFGYNIDNGSQGLWLGRAGVGPVATSGAQIPYNEWVHVCVSRDGSNDVRFFVNGTQSGSTTVVGQDFGGSCAFTVARDGRSSSFTFTGWMSQARLVKGRAVYTSNFTPSTEPLGDTSGGEDPPQGTETSLLTCQSNRFIDKSSNGFSITVSGNPKVTLFSPFAPSAAYSPSVNGGSAYFDGTADYLQVSDAALALGTDDFSIQFWVYNNAFDGSGGVNTLIDYRNGSEPVTSPVISTTNGQLVFRINGSNVISGSTLNLNEWYFIGISRASGTTKMFVNGVQVGSNYSDTNNYTRSVIRIGADYDTNLNQEFNGYMSGLKITQGAAVDFSTLGVPTTPPTVDANTSLLLNFSNAGIFDQTGKNVLEAVADCAISTTTKKYGTGSLSFDGTGDYLLLPASENVAFGTGDFTIEAWLYPTSLSSFHTFVATRTNTGTYTDRWSAVVGSSGQVILYSNGNIVLSANSVVPLNTWTHVAITRSGTTVKCFINGTQSGNNGNNSQNFTHQIMAVGASSDGTSELWNGYIDDLRITKGVARYTTTFTPPDKAFPDL